MTLPIDSALPAFEFSWTFELRAGPPLSVLSRPRLITPVSASCRPPRALLSEVRSNAAELVIVPPTAVAVMPTVSRALCVPDSTTLLPDTKYWPATDTGPATVAIPPVAITFALPLLAVSPATVALPPVAVTVALVPPLICEISTERPWALASSVVDCTVPSSAAPVAVTWAVLRAEKLPRVPIVWPEIAPPDVAVRPPDVDVALSTRKLPADCSSALPDEVTLPSTIAPAPT